MYSMSTLSPRRSAILTFIRDRIAQQGQSPSLAEISEAFGFASRSVARKHIVALTCLLCTCPEPTRRTPISYAVFCLKKKTKPDS